MSQELNDPNLSPAIKEFAKWWQDEQRKLAVERDKKFPDNLVLNGCLCMAVVGGHIIVFQDSYHEGVFYQMQVHLAMSIAHIIDSRREMVETMDQEITGIDKSKLN